LGTHKKLDKIYKQAQTILLSIEPGQEQTLLQKEARRILVEIDYAWACFYAIVKYEGIHDDYNRVSRLMKLIDKCKIWPSNRYIEYMAEHNQLFWNAVLIIVNSGHFNLFEETKL
jgi:hypothetical protein